MDEEIYNNSREISLYDLHLEEYGIERVVNTPPNGSLERTIEDVGWDTDNI